MFCDECSKCPCEPSPRTPNCNMCKYCRSLVETPNPHRPTHSLPSADVSCVLLCPGCCVLLLCVCCVDSFCTLCSLCSICGGDGLLSRMSNGLVSLLDYVPDSIKSFLSIQTN